MAEVCFFCKIKPLSEHSAKEKLECYEKAVKNMAVGKDFDEFIHDNYEHEFRSSILHLGSFCETGLELMISGILAQNNEKMQALKNLLFDESELPFSFKIDTFEKLVQKYHPELKDDELLKDLRQLRKMRNRVAHHLSSSINDKKLDRENKRIRLIEVQGLDQKFIFYKYNECKELIKKYHELSGKISDLVRLVVYKEFPDEYPEYKNRFNLEDKTLQDSEPKSSQ